MKNILVGIDFSEPDKVVMGHALKLARATQSKVHLLHVVPPESLNLAYGEYIKPPSASERKQLLVDLRHKIDVVAADLKEQALDVQADIVEDSCAARALLEYAKENACGSIFLGTHSRNLVERMILGSTAERVIRRSTIPVFVIPTIA